MITIGYEGRPPALSVNPGRRERPGYWFAALRRQRRERLTMMEPSPLDARLLRSIGINPADVADALDLRRNSILSDPMRRHDRE